MCPLLPCSPRWGPRDRGVQSPRQLRTAAGRTKTAASRTNQGCSPFICRSHAPCQSHCPGQRSLIQPRPLLRVPAGEIDTLRDIVLTRPWQSCCEERTSEDLTSNPAHTQPRRNARWRQARVADCRQSTARRAAPASRAPASSAVRPAALGPCSEPAQWHRHRLAAARP